MFDVIVVGAGSAGCVVARRLADAGRRVAVVEAGPGLPAPPSLASADAAGALAEPAWFWPGLTAATAATAGGGVPYRLGRGVGGSSAVNTLVVTIGDRSDYDRWEQELGCGGWGWSTMEPWFSLAASELRTSTGEPGPLATAVRSAAERAGHPSGGTSLEPDRPGFLVAELTVDGGRRRSAADAYLSEAPAGLEVRAGLGVRRLLLRDRVATGVELDDGTVLAAGLVVVSAGALHTPALLAASGVGLGGPAPAPASGSRWPVVAVGDHPSFAFTVALRPGARQPAGQAVAPIAGLLRWSSGQAGTGPGGDLMALVMDHVGVGGAGRRYGAVIVVLTGAASTGRLATGPGPVRRFDPGWLRHAGDRRRLRAGVRHVGELLATEAVTEVAASVHLDDRGAPLAALATMSDRDLDRWLAGHPGPVSHAAATCRLGAGASAGAALELDGAVAGYERLHVVDASVLPHLPNANPHLPVVAVAERLSAGLAT